MLVIVSDKIGINGSRVHQPLALHSHAVQENA